MFTRVKSLYCIPVIRGVRGCQRVSERCEKGMRGGVRGGVKEGCERGVRGV